MIVLHGALLDGRLALWGERQRTSGVEDESSSRHPLDAGCSALADAVRGACAEIPAPEIGDLVAWLPSLDGRPLASPLVPEAAGVGEVTPDGLRPWLVGAATLGPDDALRLLGAARGRRTLGEGLVVGPDLEAVDDVLRFALELVVRQRFLPGLVGGRARWTPVVTGPDAERLAALSAALPEACRALARPGREGPARPTAHEVRAFVEAIVDAVVRAAASRAVGAAGAPVPVGASEHDAWLRALAQRAGHGAIDSSGGRCWARGSLRSPRAPRPAPGSRRLTHIRACRLARPARPASWGPHRTWLASLAMIDPPETLAGLADPVRAWHEPLAAGAPPPLRLCFRFDEPAEAAAAEGGEDVDRSGREPFRVVYLLQSAADPSLLLSLEEALAPGGAAKVALLAGDVVDAAALARGALERAARVCPGIVVESDLPTAHELEPAGALDFLERRAWALEEAGFTVLVPAWWTRRQQSPRLQVRARARPRVEGAALSADALFDVDWELALEGEPLTVEELEALAGLKVPLVRLRGRWVLLGDDVRAALELRRARGGAPFALNDVLRLGLGAAPAAPGLELERFEGEGALGPLLDRLRGRAPLAAVEAPRGLRGELRPYQRHGLAWLLSHAEAGLGACLADDMGLGKTVQTLALLLARRERGERRAALLVAPVSVLANWAREAARFAPDLRVVVHHGADRSRDGDAAAVAARCDLLVTSYALLARDVERLAAVEWSGVVLDEAQHVKNPDSRAAAAARSLRARWRLALTGTPVENHVGDLWSIMEVLNPGLLGPRRRFERELLVPIQVGQDGAALSRLRRLVAPFVLRRAKTDPGIAPDLPDKVEALVHVALTREQATLYRAVTRAAEDELAAATGGGRSAIVLSLLTRLGQVCDHPALYLADGSALAGRSAKLERLVDMLDEVVHRAGERALVFTRYAELARMLARHLHHVLGVEVLLLDGAVSRLDRDRMVERFQSDDGPPVFVLSLRAGGTGLNLTRANHVFHYDRWWNPAVENQATDRAYRIGQRRDVFVHKLIAAGTLEERVHDVLARKLEIADAVVSGGEASLAGLSDAELLEAIALREEPGHE